MINYLIAASCLCMLVLAGCGDTDIQMATGAGMDAVKALALSDRDVLDIASQATQSFDKQHTMAPPESPYTQRLNRLIVQNFQDGDVKFSYAVHLSPEVNAFAMANGTIRLYSGIMDMLGDGELRFVIGHEMGHVVKNHIRKKIKLAYAASAVRKGVASQQNTAGDLARSVFGGLAESLMNAQFSQLEEKEADDYGLFFLKRGNHEPRSAVTALQKLAGLSQGQSFLSSHPDPGKRAERLLAQLEGRALPIEEQKQDILKRFRAFLETNAPFLFKEIKKYFPAMA